MYGFNMGWGGVWMILFWVGVFALAVWVVQALWTRERYPSQARPSVLSALELAQNRYARGEISRDEYLVLIDDLQSSKSKNKRSEQ